MNALSLPFDVRAGADLLLASTILLLGRRCAGDLGGRNSPHREVHMTQRCAVVLEKPER